MPFFNELEILESSKSVLNSYKDIHIFPTYEQFLPFTELTVSLANDAVERDLGRIDMFAACDFVLKRELSPEAMLTAIMYINRFKRKKEISNNKRLSSFTSADLFLISMMLASKYLFDDGTEKNVVNEEWAEDFGIENIDLNALEIDFLNLMDWRLHVESSEFLKLKQKVCAYLAHKLWISHDINGSTYQELLIIHKNLNLKICKVIKLLIKTIMGCLVVYLSVLISIHLMVYVVRVYPIPSYHHWNMISDQLYSSEISFNTTKENLTIEIGYFESQKVHSVLQNSFLIRSKLLPKV